MGRSAARGLEDVGHIAHSIFDGARNPSKLMLKETVRQIDQTGVKGIPIVFLISFLMGLVMAYQGALQLEKFGATIFVVDMVSISVLREMGVLLAAIMVAGRSGSAFAASLGVMNLNEEIDALRVMGLNPNQILILPRVFGLLIALPLLTLVADLAGLAGGMLLCTTVLDIGATQFTERVLNGVDLKTFLVGITKAPVFALLIAGVATRRGMQVKSSADELGRLTTVAVVQSIFLIIVADGIFTVIFARYGI
jgi:phospholipid/cholesterol/gamma-HCH transport system permease protein